MVTISSQIVLALLRYRYFHKSRNNPFAHGGIYGTNMSDFDRLQISLMMVQGSYVRGS